MADHANITRRSLVKAFPLFGIAMAAPVAAVSAASAKSISPDADAAIAEWNRLRDVEARAWQAYRDHWNVVRGGKRVTLRPHEVADLDAADEACRAWHASCEVANEAQSRMLKLLRSTDLDTRAIYARG